MQYGHGDSAKDLLCDVDDDLVPSSYQILFDPNSRLSDSVSTATHENSVWAELVSPYNHAVY